ncbi:MAG: ATP-dependent Clp protease adaptor ClpS [Phycisphaeraceae bacterium]
MADHPQGPEAQEAHQAPPQPSAADEARTQTAQATKPAPAQPKRKNLPPWKVLLHNDDENDVLFVIETVRMITTLNKQDAEHRVIEAHQRGVSLLLTTHKERAELYQQQFTSRNLTVTIEPAE